jgi:Flp pilus assembly protein TadG
MKTAAITLKQRRRRGNALVESALVLWPFILIVFGLVQIGYVIWSNNTLAYAVDAAVRYASLNGARSSTPATTALIEQNVRSNAIGLETDLLTVNVTWAPNNRPGSTVTVAAVYPVRTFINFVWIEPFALRATSRLLILN